VAPDPAGLEQAMRAGYAAWNSGDVEAFIERVDPEIVWITSGVFPGLRPVYEGHQGVREFWDEFIGPWESLEIEIEEMHALGPDSLLIGLRFHARGRDGLVLDSAFINHAVLRHGRLLRFQGYSEWSEAIDALGIEDPRGD
jgi:ketosteroid isomerase-like protein